ncbi:MAG: hypothetical protein JWN89_241 [Parcubacteria group bacterium]|nr:hypothetical protein [Parcubacteria group bacterium]
MLAGAKQTIITSHSVLITLPRQKPSGELQNDRMPYTRGGSTSIRHPVETGEPGETVRDTLRSLIHEVDKDNGKKDSPFKWRQLSAEPIHMELGPDDKNPDGTHLKVVYPMVILSGTLRDFYLPDGQKEVLGPITMVEIESLLRETEGKTVPFHYRATLATLAFAAARSELVESRYRQRLRSWMSKPLTAEESSAIAEYPWW